MKLGNSSSKLWLVSYRIFGVNGSSRLWIVASNFSHAVKKTLSFLRLRHGRSSYPAIVAIEQDGTIDVF